MGCNFSQLTGEASDESDSRNDVLFFPDAKMPCRMWMAGKACNRGHKCTYAHTHTSLTRLLAHLNNARRYLDICVYCFTCNEIADAVLAAHRRGVQIRVITDDAQMDVKGSDISRLKHAGIQVRDDGVHHDYMHHKFAVIDNEVLLNGSFNWTRHAVLGNQENVVVYRDPMLCRKFVAEFERLWLKFAASRNRV